MQFSFQSRQFILIIFQLLSPPFPKRTESIVSTIKQGVVKKLVWRVCVVCSVVWFCIQIRKPNLFFFYVSVSYVIYLARYDNQK